MATACTLAARGLRLPARQRRAGAVAVRAASTRMPPPTSSHSHPDKPKDLLEVGDVASIVATLGLTGSTIGTYMDGIHTRAQVLIYDKLPLVHGGLHTSAVVPPLLAGKCRDVGSWGPGRWASSRVCRMLSGPGCSPCAFWKRAWLCRCSARHCSSCIPAQSGLMPCTWQC